MMRVSTSFDARLTDRYNKLREYMLQEHNVEIINAHVEGTIFRPHVTFSFINHSDKMVGGIILKKWFELSEQE